MTNRFLTIAATAALLATPAWAVASSNGGGNGNGNGAAAATPTTPEATTPTTPPATTPDKAKNPKAKAYGYYCKGQSKKHVKGTPGTPFSACVKAMKALDKGTTTSPKTACKQLSKKHVKGSKGTPFSQCVKAGNELLADKA